MKQWVTRKNLSLFTSPTAQFGAVFDYELGRGNVHDLIVIIYIRMCNCCKYNNINLIEDALGLFNSKVQFTKEIKQQ